MSSDQRPGKVRVFSSGSSVEQTRRPEDYADTRAASAANAVVEVTELGNRSKGFAQIGLISGLFLVGCAGGGALLAWLGMVPGGGQ